MYIQLAIRGFRRELRNKLQNFKWLKKDFYDPNMEFDSRLREYQVSIDDKFLPNSEDWLGIIWNRAKIDKGTQARPNFCLVDKQPQPNPTTGTTYPVKFATVPFEVAVFSNSPLYLENFEEEFFFEFMQHDGFTANFPVLGETPVKISELQTSSPQKLERKTKGTLIQLPISISLSFPIVQVSKKKENLPLILEVPFDHELESGAVLGEGGIYIMDC